MKSLGDPLGVIGLQEHGGVGGTRCQLDLLSQQKLTTFIPKLTIGELSGDSGNMAQLIKDTYSVSLLEKLHEMIRTPVSKALTCGTLLSSPAAPSGTSQSSGQTQSTGKLLLVVYTTPDLIWLSLKHEF